MAMTSPMRRKAQELANEAKLPADNWLARRAETILAPLAPHVIDYFDLVGRPDLRAHQGSGNFTSL